MRLSVGSNVGALVTELSSPAQRQAAPLRSRARLRALRVLAPVFKTLASRRPNRELPVPDPRLLLIRPDHLGDVLLAAPAGLALRAALPRARIDWLLGPWAADIIDRAPHADAVMTCEFPGFTRRPKRSPWEPYVELRRLARRLRERRYDLALILRPDHWWGAMLATAAGIPHRLGYGVAECRPFLTRTLPVDERADSVDRGLALARLTAELVGRSLQIEEAEPRFTIESAERAWARELIESAGPVERPLVAIHPGSGAAVKNWLPERWRAVGAAVQRTGAGIVLTGSGAEAPLLDEIATGLERPPVLAGRTSLGQLAALFERCQVVLGVDSGPLHLAAAVGTPTVRVYGPTDVAVFGPRGDPSVQRAVRASLPCQPCGNIANPPCGAVSTPACLRVVLSEMVIQETLGLLGRVPSRP